MHLFQNATQGDDHLMIVLTLGTRWERSAPESLIAGCQLFVHG
jgi:hypothetical protein